MSTVAPQHRTFVLLTGATGLVGGLVLANLLRCEIPVAVMARANRRQSASDRVESLMQRLEERFGGLLVRPVVLSGDLCTPGPGLSASERGWLAENCGSVIHSAANLLFRPASEHPQNEPFRTNVEGTRNLLDLTTAAGITEWHYVSTAYVAGLRTGRILEDELNVGQRFANDYECSKSVAEQLLRDSCGLEGREDSKDPLTRPADTFSLCEAEKGRIGGENGIQSLTVYRPSIVIDLHPTSSMQSDQTINTSFAMFEALSQRFGLPDRGEWIRLLGFRGDERKNIVTADWVAKMITQIYRRPALHGQTYHLTNPAGVSVSELEDGFRAACEESGKTMPRGRLEVTATFNQQAAPFVAAFNPYFRDDPIFDRNNAIRAMQTCDEADVPLLTAGQIRDFCLWQARPTALAAAVEAEASAWTEFVQAVERGSASLIHPAQHRGTLLGLELSGPGGGQWLVEDSPDGLRVHISDVSPAPVRWIATAHTLNQLIEGQLSVSEGIESGLLMIEVDQIFDSPAGDAIMDLIAAEPGNTPLCGQSATSSLFHREKRLVEQFSKLIARIRRHCSGRQDLNSEVANVG